MHHDPNVLISIFQNCFEKQYNTRLIWGKDEPLYLPKTTKRPYHTIYFAHGFYRSALHECAHWCLAGKHRRLLVDYGYWYIPDGRSALEQEKFYAVEVKPQALEWIFCVTVGYKFTPSFDNLNHSFEIPLHFFDAICNAAKHWITNGLPKRAAIFQRALASFYQNQKPLSQESFEKAAFHYD